VSEKCSFYAQGLPQKTVLKMHDLRESVLGRFTDRVALPVLWTRLGRLGAWNSLAGSAGQMAGQGHEFPRATYMRLWSF
jgi:hypothetical protein